MRSLAIVTNHESIYPPADGASRRIWGLASELSTHGFDISILAHSSVGKPSEEEIGNVRIYRTPPRIWTYPRLYLNPSHVSLLGRMTAHDQLDLVQLEFPFVLPEAAPFRLLRAPLVLDQHGVEIDFVKEIARSKGVGVSRTDLLSTAAAECLALRLSSLVLCCSEIDRNRMWQLYGRRHGYAVVENGVGDEFFDSVEPYPFRKPTVLYVGSFDHAPNRYAVSWILQQILPRVSKAIPDVQFAFVGSTHWASPPELTGALVFTNVQDVRPYIRGASVALSTVLHGSGTRLKTLEYLACGTPVVSTAKGVEGLALQDQTDLLVADGHEQVARMVIEALRSLDRAKEMAAHGRDVVRERYTWKSIVARSLQAYNRLLR